MNTLNVTVKLQTTKQYKQIVSASYSDWQNEILKNTKVDCVPLKSIITQLKFNQEIKVSTSKLKVSKSRGTGTQNEGHDHNTTVYLINH